MFIPPSAPKPAQMTKTELIAALKARDQPASETVYVPVLRARLAEWVQ